MSHSLPEVAQLCMDGKLCRASAEVADEYSTAGTQRFRVGMVKEPSKSTL